MTIKHGLLNSFLDDDLYKFTVGQVMFYLFPNVNGTYKFINRNNTPFPKNFLPELKNQIKYACQLTPTASEINYLSSLNGLFKSSYLDWLSKFQLEENQVDLYIKNGRLEIDIHGPLYKIIYWEIKLLAIISELYFKLKYKHKYIKFEEKIFEKGNALNAANCNWIDFGTRRRFSYHAQRRVDEIMSKYAGFKGTSNLHLAHQIGLKPIGTYGHEGPMAMQGIYGPIIATKQWMKIWSEFYNGKLGIHLTDTFTTDVFLRDFDSYYAKLADGTRHDSSDPIPWGIRLINHYKKLDIPTHDKWLVFSDGLTTKKYIDIDMFFRQFNINRIAGIGTHLTNDVDGVTPLNIVIKLVNIIVDGQCRNVVKLSDVDGKNTGEKNTINNIKGLLNI